PPPSPSFPTRRSPDLASQPVPTGWEARPTAGPRQLVDTIQRPSARPPGPHLQVQVRVQPRVPDEELTGGREFFVRNARLHTDLQHRKSTRLNSSHGSI